MTVRGCRWEQQHPGALYPAVTIQVNNISVVIQALDSAHHLQI